MAIDLYLQLQKNLVRGFNIQTLEFRSWIDKEGQLAGEAVITYLCGERIRVPYTPGATDQERIDERTAILEKIIEIQETGCYPQKTNTCELGITSLN